MSTGVVATLVRIQLEPAKMPLFMRLQKALSHSAVSPVCFAAEGLSMKFGWVVLLVAAAAAIPQQVRAQAVYGEFSGSTFNDLASSRTLYGGTAGVRFGSLKLFHVFQLGADIQGRIVSGSNESLKGMAIGPRLGLPLHRGFTPYGEIMVGFGRYTSTSANVSEAAPNGTTDSILEFNGGLTKRLTPHIDAVADYSLTQLFALGGLYNPKTISLGAVYYFTKR
jgi:hypothetical protein